MHQSLPTRSKSIRHGRSPSTAIRSPQTGYDIVASSYEETPWFEFWVQNETPIFRRWSSKFKAGSMLDAGSGTGLYRPLMENAGHYVVGADISGAMLQEQKRKFPTAHLCKTSLEGTSFSDKSFDYVLCARVLSHAEDPFSILKEFSRVLKPGGIAMLADIHPSHCYSQTAFTIGSNKVRIRTHKHSLAVLRSAISRAGFGILNFEEHHLCDLSWKPPHDKFEKIYREPLRPIFWSAQVALA